MEFKPVGSQPTRSENQHRRQSILQIWMPLGVIALIVIALAVWAVLAAGAPGPSVNRWANVSAVIVILPICLAGIVFFLLLVGSIYLTARIYQGIPGVDRKVQAIFSRIEQGTRRVADQVVKPIYSVKGWSASAKRLREMIFHQ